MRNRTHIRHFLRTLLAHPNPRVCKHWVACELLDEMPGECNEQLISAIVEGDDGTALDILDDQSSEIYVTNAAPQDSG